jgi:hypothetical protein
MPKSDPESYTTKQSNPYLGHETVDISSDDHTFSQNVRGFMIKVASGDLIVHMVGDADGENLTIPVVVPTGGYAEVRSYVCDKVIKTGTEPTMVIEGLF